MTWRIRIDVPTSEDRRDAVERRMFERIDAQAIEPDAGRIAVDVPANEVRRDRIEHAMFAELAAIRSVERADSAVPPVEGRRWLPWIAVASAAAVALVAWIATHNGSAPPEPTEPWRVVTPAGGTSRFTVADAVVDAGSDTNVEVTRDAGGGVTLALARGTVDCDVEPRAGRPPFRVVAGDVTVEVVGTRFTVARSPVGAGEVRVDVARGKVSVRDGGRVQLVVAGQTWTQQTSVTATVEPPPPTQAKAEPPPSPIVPDDIEMDPVQATRPAAPVISQQALYEAAQRLEYTDRDAAVRELRKVARTNDAKYAALALFTMAQIENDRGRSANALAVVTEYQRRFPRGTNAEEIAWIRVDALRKANSRETMVQAAADYLRRYPNGTYAALARKLSQPPSP